MKAREVVFVPIRREHGGEEFVDLSGAAFGLEQARRLALDAPSRWAKDRPLLRVARCELVELGGGVSEEER